ncbi:permease prefix domain 1-containing protein [Yeguia hominis]|uniref:Uncharacterized protein n=1 Tax=Yeguia hominis TaxID=2763662 RepID=A0A926DCC6_9FIRM|nr:permease prefix domain 1-containing protein [Yeguia hominis]MBC8534719.1 hypothetical protein [Yeguia hominis]
MYERLRTYMDDLFSEAPNTRKTAELKEEMLQNLYDKYQDLLAEGKTEETAFNLAVASVGDISGLLSDLESEGSGRPNSEIEKSRRRSALLVSIAVMLYILSVIPCILFEDTLIGIVLMFIMIAVATGLIIYNGMTKEKYIRADDTVVEEFREWKAANASRRRSMNAINSAIWSLTVAVYLVVSFLTSAWQITWIIFLIGTAVTGMVKAIFDLGGKR